MIHLLYITTKEAMTCCGWAIIEYNVKTKRAIIETGEVDCILEPTEVTCEECKAYHRKWFEIEDEKPIQGELGL
jgi:hypothetical protein